MSMRRRVLVTGGSGFVGSHVAEALIARGHDVTIYDAVPSPVQGARMISGNLVHGEHLTAALDEVFLVFHFAANASVRGGATSPTLDLEQNLIATSRLLEAMRYEGVARIVFASSSAVYGDADTFPLAEACPFPRQTSFYGASKVAAEALISAYCHNYGWQGTAVRFVPILGERYRRGFVYDFWQKIRANPNHIEVLGTGKQRHSYVYVKDAAQAVLLACQHAKTYEVFNVGSDETSTIDQSLDVICEVMRVHPERVYTNTIAWAGDADRVLDWTRLREMGWTPTVSIRDALRRTIASFHA